MKQKMSITIDEDKIALIENLIKQGIFRNKSHALEQGLDVVLNKIQENK